MARTAERWPKGPSGANAGLRLAFVRLSEFPQIRCPAVDPIGIPRTERHYPA
jgi:hypothetical protein